ncbi:MAG: hypothetical protein RIB60_06135 [Phycisphaerales bacterium]
MALHRLVNSGGSYPVSADPYDKPYDESGQATDTFDYQIRAWSDANATHIVGAGEGRAEVYIRLAESGGGGGGTGSEADPITLHSSDEDTAGDQLVSTINTIIGAVGTGAYTNGVNFNVHADIYGQIDDADIIDMDDAKVAIRVWTPDGATNSKFMLSKFEPLALTSGSWSTSTVASAAHGTRTVYSGAWAGNNELFLLTGKPVRDDTDPMYRADAFVEADTEDNFEMIVATNGANCLWRDTANSLLYVYLKDNGNVSTAGLYACTSTNPILIRRQDGNEVVGAVFAGGDQDSSTGESYCSKNIPAADDIAGRYKDCFFVGAFKHLTGDISTSNEGVVSIYDNCVFAHGTNDSSGWTTIAVQPDPAGSGFDVLAIDCTIIGMAAGPYRTGGVFMYSHTNAGSVVVWNCRFEMEGPSNCSQILNGQTIASGTNAIVVSGNHSGYIRPSFGIGTVDPRDGTTTFTSARSIDTSQISGAFFPAQDFAVNTSKCKIVNIDIEYTRQAYTPNAPPYSTVFVQNAIGAQTGHNWRSKLIDPNTSVSSDRVRFTRFNGASDALTLVGSTITWEYVGGAQAAAWSIGGNGELLFDGCVLNSPDASTDLGRFNDNANITDSVAIGTFASTSATELTLLTGADATTYTPDAAPWEGTDYDLGSGALGFTMASYDLKGYPRSGDHQTAGAMGCHHARAVASAVSPSFTLPVVAQLGLIGGTSEPNPWGFGNYPLNADAFPDPDTLESNLLARLDAARVTEWASAIMLFSPVGQVPFWFGSLGDSNNVIDGRPFDALRLWRLLGNDGSGSGVSQAYVDEFLHAFCELVATIRDDYAPVYGYFGSARSVVSAGDGTYGLSTGDGLYDASTEAQYLERLRPFGADMARFVQKAGFARVAIDATAGLGQEANASWVVDNLLEVLQTELGGKANVMVEAWPRPHDYADPPYDVSGPVDLRTYSCYLTETVWDRRTLDAVPAIDMPLADIDTWYRSDTEGVGTSLYDIYHWLVEVNDERIAYSASTDIVPVVTARPSDAQSELLIAYANSEIEDAPNPPPPCRIRGGRCRARS